MWNPWFPPPRTGGSEWSSYPQFQTGPPPARMVRSVHASSSRGIPRPNALSVTMISPAFLSRSDSYSRSAPVSPL